MPTAAEAAVLAANQAFYAAFRSRDADAMDRLWAKHAPVACIHPGWDALRGRAPVVASFRAILGADPPKLECRGATAHVFGDTAFVICSEQVEVGGPRLIATNYFVREEGAWRIAHHQAAPVAGAVAEDDTPSDDEPPPGGLLN